MLKIKLESLGPVYHEKWLSDSIEQGALRAPLKYLKTTNNASMDSCIKNYLLMQVIKNKEIKNDPNKCQPQIHGLGRFLDQPSWRRSTMTV